MNTVTAPSMENVNWSAFIATLLVMESLMGKVLGVAIGCISWASLKGVCYWQEHSSTWNPMLEQPGQNVYQIVNIIILSLKQVMWWGRGLIGMVCLTVKTLISCLMCRVYRVYSLWFNEVRSYTSFNEVWSYASLNHNSVDSFSWWTYLSCERTKWVMCKAKYISMRGIPRANILSESKEPHV